jgi:hypothetical protein
MKTTKGGFRTFAQYLLLCIVMAETTVVAQRAPRSFPVEETTIAQIHTAMRERRLTCRALVDAYLKRIDAYDKRGPAINALVVLNPNATKEADELDRRFAQGGLHRVLVGVTGAAGQSPGAALVGPFRPMLQDHLGVVAQQQSGGTEASPVPVSVAADRPAITVVQSHVRHSRGRRLAISRQ